MHHLGPSSHLKQESKRQSELSLKNAEAELIVAFFKSCLLPLGAFLTLVMSLRILCLARASSSALFMQFSTLSKDQEI